MVAIRCRLSGKLFRRDGAEFSGNAWTFVDAPTARQLEEPMLLCVEADGPDDPRLQEALNPVVLVPETLDNTPEAQMRGLLISLQAENADLRTIRDNQAETARMLGAELADVQKQLRDAQDVQRVLEAQVAVLEQTNTELGQEYTRLLQETEAKGAQKATDTNTATEESAEAGGKAETPAETAPAPPAAKEGKAAKNSATVDAPAPGA